MKESDKRRPLGQDDVPMRYVIRESQEPHYASEDDGDLTRCRSRVARIGFNSDARKVQQLWSV
jgi:hypothetical protein